MSIFEVLSGGGWLFCRFFSTTYFLLPNFFLYFPFLISRHNVLSCLAHYWTLILSENFWLDWIFDSTLLLLAIVPKCKIHAVPSLVDLIGKWDSSWFGPKSENADLISVITHTHTAHTIRSKKIFKLLMLLLLNLMYKVAERLWEWEKMAILYCP